MSKQLLRIDASSLKNKKDEDLTKIKFKNADDLQIDFSTFYIKSKYLLDKYKYFEALESIQSEIDEIKQKFDMNDESIKCFIKLIEGEDVDLPIEHYKDIYRLSEYFCIPQITSILDKISRDELFNDLNFTIQFLLDSETEKNRLETKLSSKIENFLKERINECIKNAKFGELNVPTICRIIDQSKEKVDHNLLVDFILESIDTRFILLKFVELQKLTDNEVEKFINFISEQEDDSKNIYLEYMNFNFSFIFNIKSKYDQVLNELNQIKQEFKQTEKEFDQTKQDLNQTKQDLNQTQKELEQYKNELKKAKYEKKQYTQSLIFGGYDHYNHLGEKSNNKDKNGFQMIYPPVLLFFDLSSLLSYSICWCHMVLVMSDGSLKGIGDNEDGQISSTLQKTSIREFTDFCINDGSGRQLAAVSAVCYLYGTLYMFSKSSGNERQLVLCDQDINGGDPVFLDIGNHHPVSLFGGCCHSAAIGSEGEVIFINRDSVINSPNSPIEAVSLPDGEKASSVACCNDSVVVLSSNGRVFTSPAKTNKVLKFSPVSELSRQEIVCVSGSSNHFLTVSKEGRVFGRGSNKLGQLGLGKGTKSVSSFTEISSLRKYEIRAAYAGTGHSLFETREGKIISCGANLCGELLNNLPGENVYSPNQTTVTNGAVFCIAGDCISTVFIGNGPPPNTPNIRIQ